MTPTAGHAGFLQAMVRGRVVAEDWLISIDEVAAAACRGPRAALRAFLEQVLSEEVAAKTSENIAMRTAMARLPFVETFDYQPSIDRKQVQAPSSCHPTEHGDNVIVLGPPGVSKAHLAVSLGLKAIEAGVSGAVHDGGQPDRAADQGARRGAPGGQAEALHGTQLLIIDEIGSLPNRSRGRDSVAPAQRPAVRVQLDHRCLSKVFGDRVIAAAILDRRLHQAVTTNIRSNSYRRRHWARLSSEVLTRAAVARNNSSRPVS